MSAYLQGRDSLRRRRPLGAVLFEGGAVFRVWAPGADAVYVAGSFNAWWPRAHPLSPEPDGTWSRSIPGVSAGDQYRYVLVNGARELWRVDPYAREFTEQQGDAVIHTPDFDWGPGGRPEWPRSQWVVYRLHAPTFDLDPETGLGTLDRALARLGYLAELGINVIELAPLAERLDDGDARYGLVQPFGVETAHGGVQALKRFVATAHALEMLVLVDVAYDHFEPSEAHLWQFDGGPGGGSYFCADQRAVAVWGKTRPNYGRPEVQRYLLDCALSWLEEYRVDGLCIELGSRVGRDAPEREVPESGEWQPLFELNDGHSLARALNGEIEVRHPGTITVAHGRRLEPGLTRPLAEGGEGFGAQADDRLERCVGELMEAEGDAAAALSALEAALRVPGGEAFRRFIHIERPQPSSCRLGLPDELWPGRAQPWAASRRALLGASLLCTAPGVPVLQQGQEFGQDGERVTIPWDDAELTPVRRGWAQLIRLRRNLDGTTRGLLGVRLHIQRADPKLKFLAYHRWDAGGPRDSTMVLVNASRHRRTLRAGLPRSGTWRPRFYSASPELDAIFGADPPEVEAEPVPRDGHAFSSPITLAPYSAMVLSQDG